MTDSIMHALSDVADNLCIELTKHNDYSGRGMYGRTTCAVSCEGYGELLRCVAQLAYEAASEEDGETYATLRRDLERLHFDSLGMGIIAY